MFKRITLSEFSYSILFLFTILLFQNFSINAQTPVWTHDGPTVFEGDSTYVDGGTTPGASSEIAVAFFMTASKLASMGVVDKIPQSGTAGWAVKLRSNGDLWLRIGSESAKQDLRVTGVYQQDEKIHVAFTFADSTAKLYFNGVLDTTLSGIGYTVDDTTTHLRLGIPSVAATSNKFAGVLEQVKIYHQALSDEEISALAGGGTTSVSDYTGYVEGIPTNYNLQSYPNPFNPTTTIRYHLSVRSNISLKVFDILGQQVIELAKGHKEAGTYNVSLNGSNLTSGVYITQLIVNPQDGSNTIVKTMKIVLAK